MPKIKRVRHLVNFIKHIESYKQQHKILPQDAAQQSDRIWRIGYQRDRN